MSTRILRARWHPAVVRREWYGLHLAHFDGFDQSADEWIGPYSIRLRAK